jgi:hypothetical protein
MQGNHPGDEGQQPCSAQLCDALLHGCCEEMICLQLLPSFVVSFAVGRGTADGGSVIDSMIRQTKYSVGPARTPAQFKREGP